MKYALLFCFLGPSVACGQTVRAQLTDYTPEKLGPYCGYSMDATTLRFQLLDATGSSHQGDTILIMIPCARERGESSFVNGAAYELTLMHELGGKESPWRPEAWHISSAYAQRTWPRWWSWNMTRVK